MEIITMVLVLMFWPIIVPIVALVYTTVVWRLVSLVGLVIGGNK